MFSQFREVFHRSRALRITATTLIWLTGLIIVKPTGISMWGIAIFSVIWVLLESIIYGWAD